MTTKTVHRVGGRLGEAVFNFETGKLAHLADGAVQVQAGETTVLVAATASKNAREGVDFFPLTIDVEERMYAAGKIPGGFFRREGRPSENAILTCRLIDRPLRPCFDGNLRNEIHVVAMIQGVDLVNPPDMCALNGASAALMLSGIPFEGPVGAARVAQIHGAWIANPTFEQLEDATFEMVVAGRKGPSGDADILMVEAGGTERMVDLIAAGDAEPDEQAVTEGLDTAKRAILESIALQEELVSVAGVRESTKTWTVAPSYEEDVYSRVASLAGERASKAITLADKTERDFEISQIEAEVETSLEGELGERAGEVKAALRALLKSKVRERIIGEGIRIDGRGVAELREISGDAGLVPRIHGSGLFNRGETQVLSILTLGLPRMEQMLDDLGVEESKRYMHHYNFPPFSTGETGFMRGPKRREIGHGALAEKALLPVIPAVEDFPYALRVVSEVLSSNGSTSMASVCGSTLALLDAGVPLRAPVAGIAMGLIKEGSDFVTLTDILGAEDAWGDMDFKVAGTETMITALQLDTKISGIPAEVLSAALNQAKEARLTILGKIAEVLPSARAELNANAPRIISFKIPVDKIGEVIGPKGRRINEIIADTGVQIDVEDDGTIMIGSSEQEPAEEARRRIDELANPRMPEVGEKFNGKVVKIMDFGAFVSLTPAKDGLVHISKLGGNIRLRRVEDVLTEGDELEVLITEVDPTGRISLEPVEPPPRLAELGDDYKQAEDRPRRPRRDSRGGSGGRDSRPPRRREGGPRRDRD